MNKEMLLDRGLLIACNSFKISYTKITGKRQDEYIFIDFLISILLRDQTTKFYYDVIKKYIYL